MQLSEQQPVSLYLFSSVLLNAPVLIKRAGGPSTILTKSMTTPPTAFALTVSFELSEYSCADLPNS